MDPAIVENLEKNALRPNTRLAYSGALRRLQAATVAPLTDQSLAAYLANLFERGLSPAVPSMVVAAVKSRARETGQDDPVGPRTLNVLGGFRREGKRRGRGRSDGMTWEQADRATSHCVARGGLAGIRDAALIATMSDGMLRASEASELDLADLSFESRYGTCRIGSSKTDPEGRGIEVYLGSLTVTRLRDWLYAGELTEGLVFRAVRKNRVTKKKLHPATISRVITRRARDAGIEGKITSHSIRIGSAQSLMRAGASLVELQAAGRWKSPAMPALYVQGISAEIGPIAHHRYGVRPRRRKSPRSKPRPRRPTIKLDMT